MAASRATGSPTRETRVKMVRTLLRAGEGARALQSLGDRSSLLILRDAFLGAQRFEDFRRLTGISSSTLTSRLNKLLHQGILYRSPYGRLPSQLEYRLTDKGFGLYPFALTLWNWESHWSGGYELPPRLVHQPCGNSLHTRLVCKHCERTIDARRVDVELGSGARYYAAHAKGKTRKRQVRQKLAVGVDPTMMHSIETIGDRWTALLLATMLLGLHRYDDIVEAMDCATNIVADRLRRMLESGVIERRLYCERPPRYEYRLTPKGREFYPTVITLHDWASKWVPSPFGPGLKLRHQECGHVLGGELVCEACMEPVDVHAVKVMGSRSWVARRKGQIAKA